MHGLSPAGVAICFQNGYALEYVKDKVSVPFRGYLLHYCVILAIGVESPSFRPLPGLSTSLQSNLEA